MEIKHKQYYGLSRVASHPLILIISFLTLPLKGEGIDGWVFYPVAQGIVTGHLNSILSTIGIVLILLSWIIYRRRLEFQLERYMNLIGNLCITIFGVLLSNPARMDVIDHLVRFGIPFILFNLFVLTQIVHLFFNIVCHAYGWDELESERRINRKLLNKE